MSARPAIRPHSYDDLADDPLFNYVMDALPANETVAALIALLVGGECPIASLAARAGLAEEAVVQAVAILAKMGLLGLDP